MPGGMGGARMGYPKLINQNVSIDARTQVTTMVTVPLALSSAVQPRSNS